ncbi:recombinase RecT, partial [Vibrio vulnificus]
KRLDSIEDIDAQVVHRGDKFEIGADEIGHIIVTKFEPSFANLDKELIGAFAFIKLANGRVDYTVMTKAQIDTSWAQSRNRQNNVQKKFSDEMAKRTVLNRAAKMFINTSDDSDLLTGSINSTTEAEYEE